MPANNFNIQGLNNWQIKASREKIGYNRLSYKKESNFFDALPSLVKEPLVVLLLIASAIYFISGDIGDGIFLAAAIPLIISITIAIVGLLILVPPFAKFLKFERLTVFQFSLSISIGLLSVMWYEAVKWKQRNRNSLIPKEPIAIKASN